MLTRETLNRTPCACRAKQGRRGYRRPSPQLPPPPTLALGWGGGGGGWGAGDGTPAFLAYPGARDAMRCDGRRRRRWRLRGTREREAASCRAARRPPATLRRRFVTPRHRGAQVPLPARSPRPTPHRRPGTPHHHGAQILPPHHVTTPPPWGTTPLRGHSPPRRYSRRPTALGHASPRCASPATSPRHTTAALPPRHVTTLRRPSCHAVLPPWGHRVTMVHKSPLRHVATPRLHATLGHHPPPSTLCINSM